MAFRWIAWCIACIALPAAAQLKVFATYPEWGALARELGGDKVSVYVAGDALQDPHRVPERVDMLVKVRAADLLIATGVELEAGWLPTLLRQSGNWKVRHGTRGYFEAAAYVPLLDKPRRLERRELGMHSGGDPHVQTNPREILRVATALASRMAEIDSSNGVYYHRRFNAFEERWNAAIRRWERRALPLRGMPVVVQHKAFTYLIRWLGMREVAVLEPRPGVQPTAADLSQALAALRPGHARLILRAAYENKDPSEWISEQAKIPVVPLPFTVGAEPGSSDLFGLFDVTIERLVRAAGP